MPGSQSLIPVERIERAILLIRGHKVLLDADLAALYGVGIDSGDTNKEARKCRVRQKTTNRSCTIGFTKCVHIMGNDQQTIGLRELKNVGVG